MLVQRSRLTLGGKMDVADWLRTLSLGQYEAAFRENSVTTDLLLSLTPEDLKDLGITAVGHRRRLFHQGGVQCRRHFKRDCRHCGHRHMPAIRPGLDHSLVNSSTKSGTPSVRSTISSTISDGNDSKLPTSCCTNTAPSLRASRFSASTVTWDWPAQGA